MKFSRHFLLSVALGMMSCPLFAQSTAIISQANNSFAQYQRSASSGTPGLQAYNAAYNAVEQYISAIKNLKSDSEEYALCKSRLRELFPVMSDGAYFFAGLDQQEKVLSFACACIDISLLPAFSDAGLQNYPSYPILANLAASNLFNRGEYSRATEYYKAYLNTTDMENRELAFEGLARCLYEMKDYGFAAYIASQGTTYYPRNWNMLLIGIESYGHTGDDEKMDPLLHKALALQPGHKGLLEYQGKMYERQKKFENAAGVFDRLYHINNLSLDYALHYGFNLYNAGTEALHASKKPGTPRDTASALEAKAKSCFSKAAPILKTVLDNSPYAANVARALAMCYSVTNDNERLQKANNSLTALHLPAVGKTEIPTLDLSYRPTENIMAVSPTGAEDTLPKSDVDINIPETGIKSPNTYVVVFGNEKYKHHENVPYAHNDARVFAQYCEKVLGVPKKNIRSSNDATFSEIKEQIKFLEQRTALQPGEINVIFYYAGHGIPNVSDNTAYLLPADASGTDLDACISLNGLYDKFDEMQAKSVTVFLDACFSGATRSDAMLFTERFAAMEVEDFITKGNTVIFSATSEKQTAMGYDEQQHGFFTYFLLKSLQESKGKISLKTLADNIHRNVEIHTLDLKNKKQSPKVTTSPALGNSWESKMLF